MKERKGSDNQDMHCFIVGKTKEPTVNPQGRNTKETITNWSQQPKQLNLTEFRQPIQVQSHLEMSGILVQLGCIQRT